MNNLKVENDNECRWGAFNSITQFIQWYTADCTTSPIAIVSCRLRAFITQKEQTKTNIYNGKTGI